MPLTFARNLDWLLPYFNVRNGVKEFKESFYDWSFCIFTRIKPRSFRPFVLFSQSVWEGRVLIIARYWLHLLYFILIRYVCKSFGCLVVEFSDTNAKWSVFCILSKVNGNKFSKCGKSFSKNPQNYQKLFTNTVFLKWMCKYFQKLFPQLTTLFACPSLNANDKNFPLKRENF